MKLFLDTNVILDHALARESGQPYEAKLILSWAFDNAISLVISQGSFFTFAYVLQKSGLKGTDLRSKLRMYLDILEVSSTDKNALIKGIDSSFKDIEDSFQYETAVNQNCNYLITCNISDFSIHKTDTPMPITPSDFCKKILGKKKGIHY